jgi:hypothetical protein
MATELEKLAACHGQDFEKTCPTCRANLSLINKARTLGHEEAAKYVETHVVLRGKLIAHDCSQEMNAPLAAAIRALSKGDPA